MEVLAHFSFWPFTAVYQAVLQPPSLSSIQMTVVLLSSCGELSAAGIWCVAASVALDASPDLWRGDSLNASCDRQADGF
jgi:hypothetical protein